MLPQHILNPFRETALGHLSLSGKLHNGKGLFGLDPFIQKVGHDAVTGANYVGNSTHTVFDQILRVAAPNVCSVRKA